MWYSPSYGWLSGSQAMSVCPMYLTLPFISHKFTIKTWWNKVHETRQKTTKCYIEMRYYFFLSIFSCLWEISNKDQDINKSKCTFILLYGWGNWGLLGKEGAHIARVVSVPGLDSKPASWLPPVFFPRPGLLFWHRGWDPITGRLISMMELPTECAKIPQ